MENTLNSTRTISLQRPVKIASAKIGSYECEEIEVEMGVRAISVGLDKIQLHAYEAPVINYSASNTEGEIEVKNWNLKVTAGEWEAIPGQLGSRFLQYYRRAQAGELSDEEQVEFAEMCKLVDYRRFTAELDPVRYMEGRPVREGANHYLLSSSGRTHKIPPSLQKHLKSGDYFGANFTLNYLGDIIEINSPEAIELQ